MRELSTVFVAAVLASTLLWPAMARARPGAAPGRVGWAANLSTRQHGVSGRAVIVDDHTVRIEHFNYDGLGPRVYAYLAQSESNGAIANGVIIGGLLRSHGPAYVNDTITLTLPASMTLSGFPVVAIWCADFNVNFGSGYFQGSTYLPTVMR